MAVGTPTILASGEFTSSDFPHATTSFNVPSSGACIVLAYANRNTTTMPTPSMSEGVGAPDTTEEQASPFGSNYVALHVWENVAADDYVITISTGTGTFQEGRWVVLSVPNVVTSSAADGGDSAGIDAGDSTGTLAIVSATGDRVIMATFAEGTTVTGDGTELDDDAIQASSDRLMIQHMDGAATVDIGAEYGANGQHAWVALNFNDAGGGGGGGGRAGAAAAGGGGLAGKGGMAGARGGLAA